MALGEAVVGELLARSCDETLVAGLGAVESALKVDAARYSPAVLLLKGRLLSLSGKPADALVPLNACLALLEPHAAWRRSAAAAAAGVAAAGSTG